MKSPGTSFARKKKHRPTSSFSLSNGIKMALIPSPPNLKMGFVGHKTVVIYTSASKHQKVRWLWLKRIEIKTEHRNQQDSRALKSADLHDWKPQPMVE
jgi:hypothetical protein